MKKLLFILLLSPLFSLAQTESEIVTKNEIPIMGYYAVAIIVSLIAMYIIIKLAVRSALMEMHDINLKYAKKEYDRLNELLSQGKISKEDYTQRLIHIPLKASYTL